MYCKGIIKMLSYHGYLYITRQGKLALKRKEETSQSILFFFSSVFSEG